MLTRGWSFRCLKKTLVAPLRIFHSLYSTMNMEISEKESSASTATGNSTTNNNNNNNNSKNNNKNNEGNKGKVQKKKAKKEFDMSKYSKRHIALKVAYIGWGLHGFASQADNENTIEGLFFKALRKTCLIDDGPPSHYTRCGRTDKGVSAFGQVVALHLRSNVTSGVGVVETPAEESTSENSSQTQNNNKNNNNNKKKNTQEIDYAAVLNRVLPPEIRVINWAPVPSHFNARFSALYRTYKYFFVPDGYDIEAMQKAAQLFVGEHDFRNFCKMDVENVKSFNRVVLSINVERGVITISGFAFLWHQVRCMVAVLFMVGRHLESPDIISTLLNTTLVPAKPIYEMASEIPLVLFDCGYEDLRWTNRNAEQEGGTASDIIRKLVEHYEGMSHELYLKSRVVDLMLEATKGSASLPPKAPLPHIPLLKRGTEDSLDTRLKKQQTKQQSSKKPKLDVE